MDEGEQEQPDDTEHRGLAPASASRYVYEPGQPFYMHSVFYLQRLRCAPESRTSLEGKSSRTRGREVSEASRDETSASGL